MKTEPVSYGKWLAVMEAKPFSPDQKAFTALVRMHTCAP